MLSFLATEEEEKNQQYFPDQLPYNNVIKMDNYVKMKSSASRNYKFLLEFIFLFASKLGGKWWGGTGEIRSFSFSQGQD